MPYEVPPLPYDYNALEPHIDEQTMRLHHDKHHQAYVDNANKALEGTEWADRSVEAVLAELEILPEDNPHRRPQQRRRPREPLASSGRSWARTAAASRAGSLGDAINDAFGSFDELKTLHERHRRQALRLGLELARVRRHRPRRLLDGEPGLADLQLATCRSSASTCGSTPTTSSTRTAGPTTSRPGGTSSTGTPCRRSSRARTSSSGALNSQLPLDDRLRSAPAVDVAARHLARRHVDPDRPAAARDERAHVPHRHDPRPDCGPSCSGRTLTHVFASVKRCRKTEAPRERLARGHVEVEVARLGDERQLDRRLHLNDHRALGSPATGPGTSC